jgi:cbb3-type cytochrome oxidase maturation protein
MSVLYIVLPLALLVVGAAVTAFVWATNRGQFDDLDTPGLRMLHDDEGTALSRRLPKSPDGAHDGGRGRP